MSHDATRIPGNLPAKIMSFDITCIPSKSPTIKPPCREHKSFIYIAKFLTLHSFSNNNLAITFTLRLIKQFCLVGKVNYFYTYFFSLEIIFRFRELRNAQGLSLNY